MFCEICKKSFDACEHSEEARRNTSWKEYIPEPSPPVVNAIGNGEELAKLIAIKCAAIDMEKFHNEE